jgi:thiosulfate/3-mercaptopyruvate sulfurtransferase
MSVTMNKPESIVSSTVTPDWLEAHRSDPAVRLIEIAGLGQDDMAAYKAGHVPGAVCWKWKEMLWDSHMRDFPDSEEFARRMGAAGIGNDTTVVFYGEGIQFGIYAWWTLTYCGHLNVRILDGGRTRWQAEGRALTQEAPTAPTPVKYAPTQRNERMRVMREGVLETVRFGGATILDARSPEEYQGLRVGGPGGPDVGAVRYGRIPGARHIYYLDLLDDTLSFKPADLLSAELKARNVNPKDEIIAYCRMSHRATVLYFALTQILGFDKVRVYDGSWTEWGNLVGFPIER